MEASTSAALALHRQGEGIEVFTAFRLCLIFGLHRRPLDEVQTPENLYSLDGACLI